MRGPESDDAATLFAHNSSRSSLFEGPSQSCEGCSDISLFHFLYGCEYPCWADHCRDGGRDLGGEGLNAFMTARVLPSGSIATFQTHDHGTIAHEIYARMALRE
jgi:hypothetical protein